MQLFVLIEILYSISRGQQRERDVLLRVLVEAEIDGAALANQVTALKETVDSMAKVNTTPVDHTYCTVGPSKKTDIMTRWQI